MASSNQDDFDGYRKWLGIANKKRPPTHYELLGISLDEDDADVIQAVVEQRRHYVESKRGEGHDAVVTEILYRISEAEATLRNDEMRRDYDRQQDLFEKRRKNRQVDPYAPRSRVKSQPGRTVGEDSGIVKTFAGIMAVICVGFGGMAWFSFGLPWSKPAPQAEAKPVQQADPVPVAQVPVPEPAQVAQAAAPKEPVEQVANNDNGFEPLLSDSGLKGWYFRSVPRDGKPNWEVRNGELICKEVAPALISEKKFDDFEMRLEFALPKDADCGIYLRGRYELKLTDSPKGMASSIKPEASIGAIQDRIVPTKNAYNGTNQWNNLEVRLVGKTVTVTINGENVIDAQEIKGETNVAALDKNEGTPGPIMFVGFLTGVGAKFRNVKIKPLKVAESESTLTRSGDDGSANKLKKSLSGTNWINSNQVRFEWDKDGRLLHNGVERSWKVVGDRRIEVTFGPEHRDLLEFDVAMKTFKQSIKGGPDSFTGKRSEK
jgi:hypothetical protein